MHSCRRCTRESKCWNKKAILLDIISEISKGKAGKCYQQGAELLSAADTTPKHLRAEKQIVVGLKLRRTRLQEERLPSVTNIPLTVRAMSDDKPLPKLFITSKPM